LPADLFSEVMDRAPAPSGTLDENPAFLSTQLITCIGNKRALLDLVDEGVMRARNRLGGRKLDMLDAFAGSGVVSRSFKRHARRLWVNDLEPFASVAAECYLHNYDEYPRAACESALGRVREALAGPLREDGLIARLYAPRNDEAIVPGERVFYTTRNARYLDTARGLIGNLPEALRPFFLGPLLAEASIHANTSGVFKGFYKNPETGLGQFGGRKGDALQRIKGHIELRPPVLSRFSCETVVLQGDANVVCPALPELDLAYLDPPYNQHPYGSNYFMLNLLVDYEEPRSISKVSGIPRDWRRSAYNKAGSAAAALAALIELLKAKFVLVSFNSEGFIGREEMLDMLGRHGRVSIVERAYNTFRGSRNLRGRGRYVREFLFVLEKS
jgi:adenine-specific DNA-methyltransferase